MKLVTYQENGLDHVGLLTQNDREIIPVAEAERCLLGTTVIPDTMLDIIKEEAQVLPVLQVLQQKFAGSSCETVSVDRVKLLAPIPRPNKNIFCVGLNYHDHIKESGKVFDKSKLPKVPVIFSKVPTTVTGPDSYVKRFHDLVSQLDYEVELAVIIGKQGMGIKAEVAYEHVFGYTILNDVSARNLQSQHVQWLMGKSCDTFAPMGPCIVHKSAISRPEELDIQCKINGEIRQNSNTRQMIFDIPTIIETISSVITLEPGDIIATGTPAGVGMGFNPPKYLKSGDVMELEISEIGVLRNTIE
ncbi:putative protein YisK [bioreactor metagenome]|uniref:Fumarylacetoacetase-like C-terminal domain-containing protein n=1 Tax=bioreactor metagenome TaxID=1076179 RepID=A0A644TCE0_9ZZZZ|nr:fumarylacetoacetate hydrolase family protein [Negativicutes bacterium]